MIEIRAFNEAMQNEIAGAIRDSIQSGDIGTTRWFNLHNDGEKTWALVLGWNEGFDDDKSIGKCNREGMRLCGKLAYCPNNSLMHEYDIDWIMPYDGATGEVDDTESSIEAEGDIEAAIDWWADEWSRMQQEYSI